MSQRYGGIHQVAYVVKDIEAAMRHWSAALGVGPWFYREHCGVTEFTYYGKPVDPLPDLGIALANSGTLQVELIQQRNEADTLYRDFLAEHGEGAQHIAYWTEEFDAQLADLLAAGFIEGHAGRMGARGRFSYLVNADFPAGVVELSELAGGKAEYFRSVAEAASAWDGSDPIRYVA